MIGLPGETVEGRDGKVLIDGKPLSEPYLDDGMFTGSFAPYRVPPGEYWVMGDNRGNSQDSRLFANHTIPESLIVGRAFIRVWPFSSFHIF